MKTSLLQSTLLLLQLKLHCSTFDINSVFLSPRQKLIICINNPIKLAIFFITAAVKDSFSFRQNME